MSGLEDEPQAAPVPTGSGGLALVDPATLPGFGGYAVSGSGERTPVMRGFVEIGVALVILAHCPGCGQQHRYVLRGGGGGNEPTAQRYVRFWRVQCSTSPAFAFLLRTIPYSLRPVAQRAEALANEAGLPHVWSQRIVGLLGELDCGVGDDASSASAQADHEEEGGPLP